jgi:hypothetical protein
LGTEEIAILIVGVGKCVVAINPLFGFSPVEVVVGVFNDASVAVDTSSAVVEQVVIGETIPLGGGFDAESSGNIVEIGGGVVDRIGNGFGFVVGVVGVFGGADGGGDGVLTV